MFQREETQSISDVNRDYVNSNGWRQSRAETVVLAPQLTVHLCPHHGMNINVTVGAFTATDS